MCIVLLSTLHPDYPLILLNNRDEYLSRPTAAATFWDPPDAHVLGGRDLLRPEHGTWLGITRQGRIAVLTNFREEDNQASQLISGSRSRGAMVNAWLKHPSDSEMTTETFLDRLLTEDNLEDIGGFSLLCGRLAISRTGVIEPLAIISNRTLDAQGVTWVAGSPGEVYGLSNSAYSDPWPKVTKGTSLLRKAIEESLSAHDTEEELLKRLFDLLTISTLPDWTEGQSLLDYMMKLRESIFIPRLEMQHITYGTQKQTVVLVDAKGMVTFIERTLYDTDNAKPVPVEKRDRRFHFSIFSDNG